MEIFFKIKLKKQIVELNYMYRMFMKMILKVIYGINLIINLIISNKIF